jgi:pimeloyl-ACP methyl ester carboxylesterase
MQVSDASNALQYAESDGLQIAYEVHGNGAPIMLIPGFTQSRDAWKISGHVAALVNAGWRVILIDPRGHGASDKPHDPAAYGVDAVVRDIVALLNKLQIGTVVLVGYSRGSWVAMATAIRFPHRVRAVIAGGAHPYAEDMSAFRNAIAGGLDHWIDLLESRTGSLSPDARAMVLANDPRALHRIVANDREDLSTDLARSGIPVLLYSGSNDPRSAAARQFAATTPSADFVEVQDLDHFQGFFAVEPVVTLAERVRHGVRSISSAG